MKQAQRSFSPSCLIRRIPISSQEAIFRLRRKHPAGPESCWSTPPVPEEKSWRSWIGNSSKKISLPAAVRISSRCAGCCIFSKRTALPERSVRQGAPSLLPLFRQKTSACIRRAAPGESSLLLFAENCKYALMRLGNAARILQKDARKSVPASSSLTTGLRSFSLRPCPYRCGQM